jgi:Phage integrase, N-terminal SAM-like domain/Phage integrase family
MLRPTTHEVGEDRESRNSRCVGLVGPPGVQTCARDPLVSRPRPLLETLLRRDGVVPRSGFARCATTAKDTNAIFGESALYISFVRDFAAFLGRAPDTATAEDVRRFQVHQRESGVQPPTINCSVSALRFFFTMTLDRPDLSRRLVLAVLSVEEVGRLLESAPGAKYKAILGAAYGAGLRVSEVASLKVDDIDSERMLIRIERRRNPVGALYLRAHHYRAPPGRGFHRRLCRCGANRLLGRDRSFRTAGLRGSRSEPAPPAGSRRHGRGRRPDAHQHGRASPFQRE